MLWGDICRVPGGSFEGINVGECSAPAHSYFGTYRLAISENGWLIAAERSPGGEYFGGLCFSAEVRDGGVGGGPHEIRVADQSKRYRVGIKGHIDGSGTVRGVY